MASMTINLSYSEYINCSKLLNVSGKTYYPVYIPNGNIHICNNTTLSIHYRITNKRTYILYLYHDSPHTSYINVYDKDIFEGDIITIKDIAKQIMSEHGCITRYCTDDDNLKITFTSNNKCCNADKLVYKEYKNSISTGYCHSDSDSD